MKYIFLNIYQVPIDICSFFIMRDCIRYYQSLKIIEELLRNCSNYGFSEDRGYNMIKMFIFPTLMAIKIIDLKGLKY